MENVSLKVEMEIAVSQEDIDDIMVGALEGGIAYWCDKAEVEGKYLGEYGHEQIARGGQLKLHDREEDKVYTLDLERLLNGIKLYAQNPVGCNCLDMVDGQLEIDCCYVDAVACDAIIQYALFGEVVYG